MFKKSPPVITLFFLIIIASACSPIEKDTVEIEETETPMVIAHRGANDRYNESTITAYKIAAEDGVDALEIDLRMTSDGTLIAMHDETIDRTTSGVGKAEEYTLEEIEQFETVEVFSNQTVVEKIPTLNEIIETFGDTEHYYIETRLVDDRPIMEDPLIDLLNEHELISKGLVTIQSFSEKSLNRIHEIAPDMPLTLLFGKGKFKLHKAKSVPYPVIGIESTDVTDKVVNELQEKGKKVHVYFTNKDTQKAEQKRVKAYHVDGYFTDFIAYTKELLEID